MPGAVAELMDQLVCGMDFNSAETLLGDVSPQQAVTLLPGETYTIAVQTYHTLYWMEKWLERIDGVLIPHDPEKDNDFKPVAPEEWEELRSRLYAALQRAQDAAAKQDPHRSVGLPWHPQATVQTLLLQTALHTAYHLGQIAMLRPKLGLSV
jgi:uncharacterized damage-inducible protein DinB